MPPLTKAFCLEIVLLSSIVALLFLFGDYHNLISFPQYEQNYVILMDSALGQHVLLYIKDM